MRLIVAHELGHAKSRDVVVGTMLGALGVAVIVCVLALLGRWGFLLAKAGVSSFGDGRAVALLLAIVAVVSFVGGPVQALISRRVETRADVHALNLTRDPEAVISMQKRLSTTNLSDLDPSPIVFGMFATHPTGPQRIALARTWAREHGEASVTGRTLVVTNDFPPRVGGIESFVLAMVRRMPADSVVVHTARQAGDSAFDAELEFPVIRDPSRLMLPSPWITTRSVQIARDMGCDSVWFGAAAPLALMGPALRKRAGVRRIVATTHGHEVWWAKTPATRQLLRRIGQSSDVLTYLGDYTPRADRTGTDSVGGRPDGAAGAGSGHRRVPPRRGRHRGP